MLIRVRIKGTGQVVELVPNVARAMIAGGTAEELSPAGQPETAALDRGTKAATAPEHKAPKKHAK